MSDEADGLPVFKMPSCVDRHFFKGYRWWCKKCRAEVERQFADVCRALWTMQIAEDREARRD